MEVLLDALFINSSGGKVLLDFLLQEIQVKELNIHFLLDNRVKGSYPFLSDQKVTYLPNSLIKRHQFYKDNQLTLQKVLCFGNVPPTLRLKADVFTYLHNSVLFYTGPEFPLKVALSYKLKSWIIRLCRKNTDKWFVQTEFMKNGLNAYWSINPSKVGLFPFFAKKSNVSKVNKRETKSFYYISDGHPNKMHLNLIHAFKKASLTIPGLSLYLTISQQYPELINKIKEISNEGIAVFNMGWCDKHELENIYQNGGFLIYPSTLESFGLGLIEAAQFGMPVLASDLPFVHEVIKPSSTFDPYSVDSIAKSIIKSQNENLPETKLKIENRVDDLLSFLAT